jgi:hypothetical protein
MQGMGVARWASSAAYGAQDERRQGRAVKFCGLPLIPLHLSVMPLTIRISETKG